MQRRGVFHVIFVYDDTEKIEAEESSLPSFDSWQRTWLRLISPRAKVL